ncbi:variable surface protein [Plasmodium gonderi]|uniref:Variable surface protein n=1 Tax=Plasmodium gonderi TaxID=77519 RepID=A0A1Y1JXN1_PLAGO|nr:variable surface protein [Plasmodium gonderi]GAW84554.1 variable surface protein [Plasmodium gonderi]
MYHYLLTTRNHIFPTFLYIYDFITRNVSNNVDHKLGNTCNIIASNLQINGYYKGMFISNCKELISYLEYINGQKEFIDIKPSCNYFNFKLKAALEYYDCSVKSTKDAYEKMISAGEIKQNKSVSNICVNYVKDLDDITVSILEKLNKLYISFIKNKNICSPHSNCYDIYMELSENYKNWNNISFHELLYRFKEENMKYIITVNPLPKKSEIIDCSSSKKTRIIILASYIVPISILTIIFFLHKVRNKFNLFIYKIYCSFLQPLARMLSNIMNKKNCHKLNLRDSFTTTHNNLIDDKFRMSYNSLDYN